MPNAKLKNYFHLHFLVFIAGFTAILGELITIGSIPLVWYRMLIACVFMAGFIAITKTSFKISFKVFTKFFIAGIIIALHWITFFESINQANVSIALSMFSAGAFFGAIIEPIIFKRRIVWYEMLFGVLVIVGVSIIMQSEFNYINGILLGIASAFFSSWFAVLNGIFLETHSASIISFYEFISGVFCITLFLLISNNGFSTEFFQLAESDWWYIFILASICTAYAFIAATHVMNYLSPFTVILTYNMEPIYGITIALFLFPENEKMSTSFYIGAVLIVTVVIVNGLLKKNQNKNITRP
jgi:drug/metabolite transporter (DMT)-like permease